MSNGHTRPLTCCDRDCADANGCRMGGYRCKGCDRWFCCGEMNSDGYCDECHDEIEAREEDGDEG